MFAALTSHSTHSKANYHSCLWWTERDFHPPLRLRQHCLRVKNSVGIARCFILTYLNNCCHLMTRKQRFQLTYKWHVTTHLYGVYDDTIQAIAERLYNECFTTSRSSVKKETWHQGKNNELRAIMWIWLQKKIIISIQTYLIHVGLFRRSDP